MDSHGDVVHGGPRSRRPLQEVVQLGLQLPRAHVPPAGRAGGQAGAKALGRAGNATGLVVVVRAVVIAAIAAAATAGGAARVGQAAGGAAVAAAAVIELEAVGKNMLL